MSCGSIDGFKNILGDAFKDLKAALSCVDNTTAAIAETRASTSSSVEVWPRLSRSDDRAALTVAPLASSTWLG